MATTMLMRGWDEKKCIKSINRKHRRRSAKFSFSVSFRNMLWQPGTTKWCFQEWQQTTRAQCHRLSIQYFTYSSFLGLNTMYQIVCGTCPGSSREWNGSADANYPNYPLYRVGQLLMDWGQYSGGTSHLNICLLDLHTPTCCHGDEYHPATMPYTGQALLLQVSFSSRFGFFKLRHLRSGNGISFPCKVFSLHVSSLFLTPKPQVAEH